MDAEERLFARAYGIPLWVKPLNSAINNAALAVAAYLGFTNGLRLGLTFAGCFVVGRVAIVVLTPSNFSQFGNGARNAMFAGTLLGAVLLAGLTIYFLSK